MSFFFKPFLGEYINVSYIYYFLELASLQVSTVESDPEDSDEYNSNEEDSENDIPNVNCDSVTPKKSKDKSSVSI